MQFLGNRWNCSALAITAVLMGGLNSAHGGEWQVRSREDQAVFSALEKRFSTEFNSPLTSVLQSLSQDMRISIAISSRARELFQRDGATATMKFTEVSLRNVLKSILDPYEAVYAVRDGTLWIERRDESYPHVRIYDVARVLNGKKTAYDLAEVLGPVFNLHADSPTPFRKVTAYGHLLIVKSDSQGHDEFNELLDALELGLKTPNP